MAVGLTEQTVDDVTVLGLGGGIGDTLQAAGSIDVGDPRPLDEDLFDVTAGKQLGERTVVGDGSEYSLNHVVRVGQGPALPQVGPPLVILHCSGDDSPDLGDIARGVEPQILNGRNHDPANLLIGGGDHDGIPSERSAAGTNLPAKMAVQYIRDLCQLNGFAKGEFPVFGKTVTLDEVKVPLCAIACETDHIAHWRGSFNGVKQMGSTDKTFIVSQSGHIAGIINPPSKGKYGHYTSDAPLEGAPDDWMKGATFNQGSWWPRWGAWLDERSGSQISARQIGDSGHPELCPAPGSYVVAKPAD